MSLSLRLLADRYAFESSPTRHDLGALHVPFDELTRNGQTEARLDAAVRRREPVALIGASGSGKSSVIAHVLGPLAEGVAPLFVPLAAMPSETIDTPSHLADHLLATITRLAGSAAARIDEDLAPETTTITKTSGGSVGLGWSWLRGEMARQVTRQTKLESRAGFIDKTDASHRSWRSSPRSTCSQPSSSTILTAGSAIRPPNSWSDSSAREFAGYWSCLRL